MKTSDESALITMSGFLVLTNVYRYAKIYTKVVNARERRGHTNRLAGNGKKPKPCTLHYPVGKEAREASKTIMPTLTKTNCPTWQERRKERIWGY